MTKEDFAELQRLAPHLAGFRRVGIFSPIRGGESKIFPKASGIAPWRWDLNKPNVRRFDLLIASNVLMYSTRPALWFRNILASTKYFLLLDLIRRRRGKNSELGADKDSMRYAVGDERPRIDRSFALDDLGDRLLAYRTYAGGANTFDDDPRHVIALFRGDRADPVLRFDDYPTGIRPIPSDLSPFHDILRKAEARRLHYYLGIVPALLTEEMLDFLRRLEYMVPAVHGYDHAYPKYAPMLIARGDPSNQHTVGVFNEFQGKPFEFILARLREARGMLEEKLRKPVDAYIPPCNIGDRRTARALVEAGFNLYLSEKKIPGCPLPWIRSDFYGRSPQYDPGQSADVVTLHVTWEWDVARDGNGQTLDRLLDQLAERKQSERDQGSRLAAIVGNHHKTP